jgi:NAD kinase
MSKRELIECICEINRTAKPGFLANFSQEELTEYLDHLMELNLEELAVCC